MAFADHLVRGRNPRGRGGSGPSAAPPAPAPACANGERAGSVAGRPGERGKRSCHRSGANGHDSHRATPGAGHHHDRGEAAMTPEVAGRPKTALELLFGENGDTAAPLTRLILSGDAGQDLGRALEHAAKSTRAAAARDVTAAAAGLLDVSLVGVLAEGWREHHDLTSAARRTLAAPGSTELVQLAEHQVSVANHPYVTILVDG